MAGYDFSTLNSTDFEKLVCDLLNRKAKDEGKIERLYSFKEGKDRGIDLLYTSSSYDFEIVVQVKHFINSTYSKLKSVLINSENSKVRALNPKSYVFVTSQPLSFDNKKEIQNIFNPYIKSINDVFGQDDLNDILRQNIDIEETHFKLWFSSSVSLRKIMQYKYFGRSNEYQENVLKRKLRLFVNTSELFKAEEILRNKKFLIITGEPGVGKTTLSDILVYKHLSKDFELSVIYDNIYEIEDFIRDDDSKQVFYFDDFLGHTQLEIQKSKTAETFLLKQLARIEHSTNKYLILNTRKFILTSLIEESERFKNFMPLRAESKIELSSYSYGAKRRMLDNHIQESDISDYLKQVVFDCAFKICSHQSFSPRHLEFFTSSLHVGSYTSEQLYNYIHDNLKDPKNIWDHAYCQQISLYDRLLINTLYSLGGNVYYDSLEKAFNERLDFEVAKNNYIKPQEPFKACIKNLNGGFIDVQIIYGRQKISFINPSLEDYLYHKIFQNTLEIERILLSASFIEQWFYFYTPFKSEKDALDLNLLTYFKNNYRKFFDTSSDKNLCTYCVSVFLHYFDPIEILSLKLIKAIKNWDFLNSNNSIHYHYKFINSLSNHNNFRSLKGQISSSFFYATLNLIDKIFDLENTVRLFWHYDFDFLSTLSSSEKNSSNYKNSKKIQKYFKQLFLWEIDYQYEQLLKNTIADEHLDVIHRIDTVYEILLMYINPKLKVDYSSITNKDWNTIAVNNSIDSDIFGKSLSNENYDPYEEENNNNDYVYDEYDEYDFNLEKKQALYPPQNYFRDEEDDLPF